MSSFRRSNFQNSRTENDTRAVPNDPDDNHIIPCAMEGQADLIVSGDRDLLTLGSFTCP